MKPDNRYSKAIEQIKPDENFVNDTVNKLNGSEHRDSRVKLSKLLVPAAAIVTALALAVGVVNFGWFRDKTGDVGKPQPTAMTAYSEPDKTAGSAENDTAVAAGTVTENERKAGAAMPTPMPTPLATQMPNYSGDKYALQSYAPEETEVWDGMYEEFDMGYLAFENQYGRDYWNTEEYSYISEGGFIVTKGAQPSTFAADVDTAGYTVARRKILSGSLPSASAVRIEELLNYFRYTGLAPKDGSPAAISAYLGACPWNEDSALMFVGIGAQQIDTEDLPRSNLVFLIDTSGSMDGSDRLDLAKRAFHLLSDTLREGDIVSVVTYSGSFRVLLEGVDASKRNEILSVIDDLEASGSTNGGDAMITAYKLAQRYFIEGGNNRVIMMTDGDLNVGITSQSELVQLVEEKKQSGVFLSVLGFGMGNYKDSKLEALADHGNGVYSYIDGISAARRTLVTEMGANFYTVAKDVKIQVEFNPEYVQSYRLIGYENRMMSAQDFYDDTKDGGEMGSGHTVDALYELIPAEGVSIAGVTGKAAENSCVELRYQQTNPTCIEEIARIAIRYKAPDGDVSSEIVKVVTPEDTASGENERNLILASAVAEFGMLLRDSQYKGSASWDSAASLVKSLSDMNDDEAELLYLITQAKAINE